MAQWERGLAQYSHRSDSSGFAGRIGEQVLRTLWRSRLASTVTAIAYARSIEKRLELEKWLQARMNRLIAESHAIGQSSKCDGCNEATEIHRLLGGEPKEGSVPWVEQDYHTIRDALTRARAGEAASAPTTPGEPCRHVGIDGFHCGETNPHLHDQRGFAIAPTTPGSDGEAQ